MSYYYRSINLAKRRNRQTLTIFAGDIFSAFFMKTYHNINMSISLDKI